MTARAALDCRGKSVAEAGSAIVARFNASQFGAEFPVRLDAMSAGLRIWLLEAGIRPARGRLTLVFANLQAFARFDPAAHDAARFVDEDMNRQWMDERIGQPHTLERQRVAELEASSDANRRAP